MQVVRGGYYSLQSQRNAIRIIPQEAVRGRILDRNGVCLVEDRLSLNVALIPQGLTRREAVMKELAKILGESQKELEIRYRRNVTAPFAPVIIAEDIDRDKALLISERLNKLSGVIIEEEPRRNYNFGKVASHVLGYLGMPQAVEATLGDYGYSAVRFVGVTGIEKYLDSYLQGEDGGMQVEVDNRGRQVNLLGNSAPVKGKDVKLTIDVRIQKTLEELMADKRGAAIFMNPFTGEIFALVSSPSFDPNVFVRKKDSHIRGQYLIDKYAPLFNRAISGQYPSGSVFKIITTYAGLATKKIDPETHFFCPGYKLVGRREFKCWSRHGEQDLKNAFTHSCNVYFYNTGLTVGAESLSEFARKFFLGRVTGIDLPQEEPGFVPSPNWPNSMSERSWFPGDTANLAIGQGGLLVTPIQMLRLASIVANYGYAARPHVVKEVAGKRIVYKGAQKTDLNIKFLTFIRQAMRNVVKDETGTARNLEVKNWQVCAKTGTAQYGAGHKHGWLAGFLPLNAPKVAFVIFLEDSQGGVACSILARDLFNRLSQDKVYPFDE